MDFFQYKNEQLYVEDLPVKQLAEEFGTPLIFILVPHLNAIGMPLILL